MAFLRIKLLDPSLSLGNPSTHGLHSFDDYMQSSVVNIEGIIEMEHIARIFKRKKWTSHYATLNVRKLIDC